MEEVAVEVEVEWKVRKSMDDVREIDYMCCECKSKISRKDVCMHVYVQQIFTAKPHHEYLQRKALGSQLLFIHSSSLVISISFFVTQTTWLWQGDVQ